MEDERAKAEATFSEIENENQKKDSLLAEKSLVEEKLVAAQHDGKVLEMRSVALRRSLL